MKVGDLVRLKKDCKDKNTSGIVINIIQKKCWRTDKLGPMIDWRKIDPEPHAIVLAQGTTMTWPATDIEVINESR